jgi:myo-inositol-1(or 4)-monophosphatase
VIPVANPGKGNSGVRNPFRDAGVERSLIEAAEIGSRVLLRYFGKVRRSIENKGAINLVTRADKEAEAKVLRYLRGRHPDHSILAEESWDGNREVPAGMTWIVDPLDGTTNYAHGLEHFAFTIAVAFDGRPLAGIVLDPLRDQSYRAYRGRGAYLNRRRIHVSPARGLADSLLVTGFPYDRRKRIPELMGLYGAFLKRTRGVRRFGVASLDLAYVAAGKFEGYYEPGLYPWDVAAGWLLVEEAGGIVTQYDGGAFHLFSPNVLAAGKGVHPSMRRVIRESPRNHAHG